MGRARSPERDEARKIWLDSSGKISSKQLAEEVGVTQAQLRKWKSLDNWKDSLGKQHTTRRRGGQPQNKNAEGAGAPIRNLNAETHGAYSNIYIEDLTETQREYIEKTTLNTAINMLHELQLLKTKELDLRGKIAALEREDSHALFVDRVVEMLVPDDSKSDAPLKINMKTVMKASQFDRSMKLEAELNKTHGRIIKLLDSIKAYELDSKRVRLEERKYNLAKQKLIGEYDIDMETGEINDDSEEIATEELEV